MNSDHQQRRVWIDRTSELNANVREVEALLCDIDRWPSWTPGVVSIRRSAREPIRVGTRFLMVLRLGRLPIFLPCVVFRKQPGLLEWGGAVGSSAIRHSFTYEATEQGGCKLRHLEYATGFFDLITRPFESLARSHDNRWSDIIEARFNQTAKAA